MYRSYLAAVLTVNSSGTQLIIGMMLVVLRRKAKDSGVEISAPPIFDLIGTKPLTSNTDFLSDHFGIAATLKI